MSKSSGVLLSGLGQGLVQFAGIYGDTKTSSLEAEAQRLKEMRLQEIQANRNMITDSFRVAEYETSQERLGIAKQTATLAQQEFTYKKEQDLLADYDWKDQNVYGYYYTTEDEGFGAGPVQKQKWGIIGQRRIGINKKDPDDIRILNMDGTVTSGSATDLTATKASAQAVSDTATPVSFDSMSDLEDHIAKHNKAAGEPVTPEQAKSMAKKAVDSGRVIISGSATETTTPSPTAEEASTTMTSPGAEAYSGVSVTTPPPSDTAFWEKELTSSDSPLAISSDPAFVAGEKIGAGVKTAATVITDALTGDANLDSTLRLAAVNDLVKNWASDGLSDNEIRAKLEEKSEDKKLTKDQRSAFKEVLEGFTVAPRSHPQTDISVLPGGGVIDEAALDAATQASDPATIRAEFGLGAVAGVAGGPSPVTSAFGTNASGMEDASASPLPEIVGEGVGEARGEVVPTIVPDKNPVVVETDAMSVVFGYDAAKSKDFIEGLIKDMQSVNISQEDIRKELMTLLGEIPKEQANGEFAKALATAYYEFTKGSN